MELAEFAVRLASSSPDDQAMLLAGHTALVDADLARSLKSIYFDSYSSDPLRAGAAAQALSAIAAITPDPEIHALSVWVEGLALLQLEGRVEPAIERIDQAAAHFQALGQPHTAAETQIGKIFALARLGRYEEAIACGLQARDLLLAYGDQFSAGRVELNLGNIYHRCDAYREAEHFYRQARDRFMALGDQRMLIYVDNGLANVLSQQHHFRAAAELYEGALVSAEAIGLEVTQAEIECNLGVLALFQGRYDRALSYLERSRRRYATLNMPHESAVAELELADAYMELNLASEATAIYARVTGTFAELGMRAEQARSLLNYGRALRTLAQTGEAQALFDEAYDLYTAEGNLVGAAQVMLAQAQLCYDTGDYAMVAALAAEAEIPLASAGAWGRLLMARWLRGEAARVLGQPAAAEALLAEALREAEARGVPEIAQRCATSLGCLAATAGDTAAAEALLRRAVAIIDTMRTPLPADEFRTAFVVDKLTPYTELARLCLQAAGGERTIEALGYIELERSRALVEMLGSTVQLPSHSHDPSDPALVARLDGLREELNGLYSLINRPPGGDTQIGSTSMETLYAAAREREADLLEIRRRLRQSDGAGLTNAEALDIVTLQEKLGSDTTLVSYFALDDQLLAFIVTHDQVQVVSGLGCIEQVEAALAKFHFQINALSTGAEPIRSHMSTLVARTKRHLGALYDLLLGPIEDRLGTGRLVVVPHRALHYVPFHALYNGSQYIIEQREVCYAPSVTMLQLCLARPQRALRRALLVGVSGAPMQGVIQEVQALAALFEQATVLIDGEATIAAIRAQAVAADVVHLACHGRFRPDSPLFSSLRLGDGWLTVYDAYSLDLQCQLVTLSACETGMNIIAPGDELLGLTRGFFSTGAPSLLVSLWSIDDETATVCMRTFYQHLCAGARPAAALRQAQLALLAEQPHPFFWSPFILLGRW